MTNQPGWETMIGKCGGELIYIPSREIPQTPLLVLHNGGIGLAEPLHNRIVPLLDALRKVTILGVLKVNGQSILDALKSIVTGFIINGITITVPIFTLALVIAGYLSDTLTIHREVTVGIEPTSNTPYEILAEYFDPQLVL